jgi:phosphate-selective porin OprO/OprP
MIQPLQIKSLTIESKADIEGGEQHNTTAGLNWYLNPYTRIMFNYVYAEVEGRADVEDGNINIFQGRFQVYF